VELAAKRVLITAASSGIGAQLTQACVSARDAATAELVDGAMDAIAREATGACIPQWFQEIAIGKVGTLEGVLAGSAAWMREEQET